MLTDNEALTFAVVEIAKLLAVEREKTERLARDYQDLLTRFRALEAQLAGQ